MIAIIAAMDVEVQAIKDILDDKEEFIISQIPFCKGMLCGKELLIMKSGVGKGNAAMSTTILLERFSVSAVINIGTAGGLMKHQEVLDAVVSDRVVQHDYDTSAMDGLAGIGLYYAADSDLADLCTIALEKLDIRVHRGLIASGDQFISDENQLSCLAKRFPEAMCAEMEAGTVAQVCTHYGIPFVVLRSLSDIAHNVDSHMDFVTYVTHASTRSASFCKEVINILD